MPLKRDVSLARRIGKKISELRGKKFPGHGGAGGCIAAFYNIDKRQVTQTQRVKWSKWERGVAIPEDKEQRRLADFFGITLGELRGESNFNQKHGILFDKGGIDDLAYDKKGDMSDSNGVEFLKDHLATLKQDKADLLARVAVLEKELAELREENKRLLTLSTAKGTRQAGSA